MRFLFAGKFETQKAPDLLTAFIEAAMGDSVHPCWQETGKWRTSLKAMSSGNRSVHFRFSKPGYDAGIVQDGRYICIIIRGPGETWGLAVNEAMGLWAASCCQRQMRMRS